MGPPPPSHNNLYVFVVVDYVSKWVETVTTPTSYTKVIIKFLKKNIFIGFDTTRALLTDNGTHFSTSTKNYFERNIGRSMWLLHITIQKQVGKYSYQTYS